VSDPVERDRWERMARTIWGKDSPDMLERVRPRLESEVAAAEAWLAREPASVAAAEMLEDARYFLGVFDDVRRQRGLVK
jgi:hypothetical protein